jgi:predicted HicB family RNase H-like nuclease
MTAAQLRDATKQFDEEYVADKSRPLTSDEQEFWERTKRKGTATANGKAEATITVRLQKELLKRCTALAKKKRWSRDALIARGLRALLAQEAEKAAS